MSVGADAESRNLTYNPAYWQYLTKPHQRQLTEALPPKG